MDWIRASMIMLAGIAFGLGISLPLFTFEKFYFFEQSPSLLQIIAGLWAEDAYGLAAIISVFSILFPVVKLVFTAAMQFTAKTIPGWALALSKWSMMDVLLVAILVFAAKTSGLASAFTQAGLWFYAIAAIFPAIVGQIGSKPRQD